MGSVDRFCPPIYKIGWQKSAETTVVVLSWTPSLSTSPSIAGLFPLLHLVLFFVFFFFTEETSRQWRHLLNPVTKWRFGPGGWNTCDFSRWPWGNVLNLKANVPGAFFFLLSFLFWRALLLQVAQHIVASSASQTACPLAGVELKPLLLRWGWKDAADLCGEPPVCFVVVITS